MKTWDCWLKLLIVASAQTLMDLHITVVFALTTVTFDEKKSWQRNHQHVILKDIDCDTLLAGASALCFSSLIVVAKCEREEKGRVTPSEQNPAGFQHLMTEAVCVWGTPRGSGAGGEKKKTWTQQWGRQRERLLMPRCYLAGNLGRGQCLYASMWQCVRAACRNVNKVTVQLVGTLTQIRCS